MKLVRSAALVIGTIAALLVPAAAHADVYVGYDPTRDVKLEPDTGDDPNGGFYVGAADRVFGDVVRMRVVHTVQKVRVSMTYRALAAAGKGASHQLTIGSNRGRSLVEIQGVPGHWLGKPVLSETGTVKACAGLRGRIDYTNDHVIVEVPRSCLDHPTWVQVSGEVDVFARAGVYSDWPMTWGYRPVFTPRIPI